MQTAESTSRPRPVRASGLPRTDPRITLNRRAVLSMPRTGRPHPVLLRNISQSGACVRTDAPLALGEDVRLKIDVGDGGTIVLKAIVIGVRPQRETFYADYGLKFLCVSAACAAALAAFVLARSKR